MNRRTKMKINGIIRKIDVIVIVLVAVALLAFMAVNIFSSPQYDIGGEEQPSDLAVNDLSTTPSPIPTETPLPKPTERPEILAAETGVTTLHFEWIDNGADSYYVEYRAKGSYWMTHEVEKSSVDLTGLKPGTSYEVRMQYVKNEAIREYISSFGVETETQGYGDPFRAIGMNLKLDGKEQRVMVSSENGCLGATAWVEFTTKLYKDDALKEEAEKVTGGTQVQIACDAEGRYCRCLANGAWSVYVLSADEKQCGWIAAEALLIDLCDLFPQENIYSIRCDRANAYSSLFTVGGNPMAVTSEGNEDSRFASLKDKNTIFATEGRNVIEKVTGEKLPNYGAKEQMPVIWSVALELIQCQENALQSGCTLLIYEGYRPAETSKFVNKTVTSHKYLSKSVSNRNLANGFLNVQLYEGNYIANTSKHNMGIAVDLTLQAYSSFEELGKELVMQTKMHTLDYRSHMNYNNECSNLLYKIMTTDTDLVCLRKKQEWWHFELAEDVRIFPFLDSYVYADYEI